ncbi:MAG: RIP metalloprotease RseP [Gammaproteobacteria bacterium]|nr:RIP metalloprotease RseP [Gammaproteobacteria bacterium]
MDWLLKLAIFIAAISILVVVHEFGHYWVARLMGVKVTRFSVGFGRPLWLRRAGRDRTEWVLSAIPLGGYVKMLDESEGRVAKKDLRRAFNRQPIPRRSAIVLAGPLFNFLFAILVYALLFTVGIDGLKPVVGKVDEDSPAARAGFRAGDELVSIDGKPVASWDQRRMHLYQRALDQAQVEVVARDALGVLHTRRLDLSALSAGRVSAGLIEREIGMYGYSPEVAPVLGSVEAGSVAAQAGLRTGDRIARIDGAEIRSWQEAVTRITASPGAALALTVDRQGVSQVIKLVPQTVERNGQRIGRIGVGVRAPELPPEMRVVLRYDPPTALWEGAQTTWDMSVVTLRMLYLMVLGEVSMKAVSGPITIAQYAHSSAMVGLDRFVMFLAIISVGLGVLNLLPIPILDGGQLLYHVIEAVKGGPLSERALYWGQMIGLSLLGALMLLAFYNDFARILQ